MDHHGASPISEQVLTGAIRTLSCRFMQAYDRFLRGVALFDQNQFLEALEQFRGAVTLEPEFAEAHAWSAAALGRIALVAGPQLAEPMRREVRKLHCAAMARGMRFPPPTAG